MSGIAPRPHFAEQHFRKASASAPGRECVQVARGGGWVVLRDDKVPFGSEADARIAVAEAEFDAFQDAIRADRTDGLPLRIEYRSNFNYALRGAAPLSPTLTFTAGEIVAFLDGIRRHEFDPDRYPAIA